MKTAEEWAKSVAGSKDCLCGDIIRVCTDGPCPSIVRIIRAVQREAIEAAADKAQHFEAYGVAAAIRSLLPPAP